MKKLISILLAFALCISLVACGSGDSPAPDKVDTDSGLVYPFNIVNAPMGIGKAYKYKTVCYQDTSLETNGYVYIKDYTVTPAGDGMVEKSVTATFLFDDDNAWYKGMYFDILYADMNGEGIIDDDDNEWTVTMDGTEYDVDILRDEFSNKQWLPEVVYVADYTLTVRVPEGYDDIVLMFYNSRHKLNVAPDGEDIPDGTAITSLTDSHSQWFVLGGEDGTYYGKPIEFGRGDGDPQTIISQRVYEGDAPPPAPVAPDDFSVGPDENYTDDPDIDDGGFTYVEIDNWSHDSINPNEKMGVEIHYSTYNTFETDYVMAQAFVDGVDEPIFERKMPAYEEGRNSYYNSVTFVIDGPNLPADAASVNFWYKLYDEAGTEISATQMDIPVEEPQRPGTDATVKITDFTPGEISKSESAVNVDIYYEIEGYTEGMSIIFSVKDGNEGDVVDFADFETEEDGAITTIIPANQLLNDNISIKIRLFNKYGDEMSSAICNIPMK